MFYFNVFGKQIQYFYLYQEVDQNNVEFETPG